MPDTPVEFVSWEEASHCPKCGTPGKDMRQLPTVGKPKGTLTHFLYCYNERCVWFNTAWIVQTNPDGMVPKMQRQVRAPKQTPFDPAQAARVREALARQVELETQPGGAEVANPNNPRP
jgi:hypothetical protein